MSNGLGEFLRLLASHPVLNRLLTALLLLAAAALLLYRPQVFVAIVRYGTAILSIALAIWLIVSTVLRQFRSR